MEHTTHFYPWHIIEFAWRPVFFLWLKVDFKQGFQLPNPTIQFIVPLTSRHKPLQ